VNGGFAKACGGRRKILSANHPHIFDSDARLGEVLAEEGRFQEAEPLLSAWHGMENASAAQLPRKRLGICQNSVLGA
jgi:hypothetical protein